MLAHFTQTEKTLLDGHAPSIATKHGCSQKYVRMIILGDRRINTELSKKIYKDLQALVELLTPEKEDK